MRNENVRLPSLQISSDIFSGHRFSIAFSTPAPHLLHASVSVTSSYPAQRHKCTHLVPSRSAPRFSFHPIPFESRRRNEKARRSHISCQMSDWESAFSVSNPRNERLAGLLNASRELVPGDSVMILCHGFLSSKCAPLLSALCAGLVASQPEGHGIARFDFSGNGDSEGRFCYANYAGEAEDLRAVIEHLRHRGLRVHAVLGHSKAATVVLLYAAKYGDVQRVVNLAGRLRMEGGVRERFGENAMKKIEEGKAHTIRTRRMDGLGQAVDFVYEIRMEDLKDRLSTDVMAAVKKLPKGIRVLTVHGAKDESIPVQDGRDLHAGVEDGELVVFDEAGHSFEGFEQKVVDVVAKFCYARAKA